MKKFGFLLLGTLLQACASDIYLKPEDRQLLMAIKYEKPLKKEYHLQYQGPAAVLGRSIATVIPGIGTGLAAGAASTADDSSANELDKVVVENKLFIDDMLFTKFKTKLVESKKGDFVAEGAKVTLRIVDVGHGFERFVGNPDYQAGATFELVEGDRVIWRYRATALGKFSSYMPSFSYEDLMIKDNMLKVFESATDHMVEDALKNLEREPRDPSRGQPKKGRLSGVSGL